MSALNAITGGISNLEDHAVL